MLWAGQLLSQAGDAMYQIALMWFLLDLTQSKALTGLAAMSAYVPTLIFGLIAGAVADQCNRRYTMMAADLIRAALVMSIPLMHAMGLLHGQVGAWCLVIVTFMAASVSSLFNPARDALIPDIVAVEKLPMANGMIQTSWQAAICIGPLLAASLIPVVGMIALFRVDAVTYLISFLFIFFLPVGAGRVRHETRSGIQAATRRIKEGLRFTLEHRPLRGLMRVTASYNLVLMGLPFVGTPIFVREVLDGRPETYAFLNAVYAIGMVPGILLARALSTRIRAGSLVLWGIVFDGLTYMPFLWIRTVPQALLFTAVHACFIPLILVPRTTLVQTLVPHDLRGRVFSVLSICVVGFSALSSGLIGMVSEYLPVEQVFFVFGGLTAAVGFLGFLDRPLAHASIESQEVALDAH